MSEISAASSDPFRLVSNTTAPPKPVAATKPKDSAAVLNAAASANTTGLDPATIANAKAAVMTARADTFFAAANGPYTITTPTGDKTSVKAGAQFRMVGGFNYHSEQRLVDGKKERVCTDGPQLMAALGPMAGKLSASVNRVIAGRGTPEDVRAITQALIDRGKLGPVDPKNAEAAIQALQWKYGVGVDCAGYVQRAFFAARGMSGTASERVALGLDPLVANEGFQGLPTNPKWKSVSVASARAGDVMLLGPPDPKDVGHVVLVRSNALVDPSKLGVPAGTFKGPVRMIEVDSSWGAGEEGKGGGVQRRTFLYDESSGKWASYDATTKKIDFSTTNGPYNHPLSGIYRPKSES